MCLALATLSLEAEETLGRSMTVIEKVVGSYSVIFEVTLPSKSEFPYPTGMEVAEYGVSMHGVDYPVDKSTAPELRIDGLSYSNINGYKPYVILESPGGRQQRSEGFERKLTMPEPKVWLEGTVGSDYSGYHGIGVSSDPIEGDATDVHYGLYWLKHIQGFMYSNEFQCELIPDSEGRVLLTDLRPERDYTIQASMKYGDHQSGASCTFKTGLPRINAVRTDLYRGFDYKITPVNPDDKLDACGVIINLGNQWSERIAEGGADGQVHIYGLGNDTDYEAIPFAYLNGDKDVRHFYHALTVRTKRIEINSNITATQSTLTFSPKALTDASNPDEAISGYIEIIDTKERKNFDSRSATKVVFDGLLPSKTYSYLIHANYGLQTQDIRRTCKTLDVPHSLRVNRQNYSPTVGEVRADYTEGGDWTYDKVYLASSTSDEMQVPVVTGANAVYQVYGLQPNMKNTVVLTFENSKNGEKVKYPIDIQTTQLQIETLDPKVVALGSAVLAANTNIDNAERNVGFVWKKYEAPASLKPTEGYGAAYDGRIEGYVHGLQTTSFYNVAPFYRTNIDIATGEAKYYYGEWITIDPSDFSWYEPTLHTYDAAQVTHSSAVLRGTAMPGSDEIYEQGFEYWLDGISKVVKSVRADQSANVATVMASGVNMTAVVDGLKHGSTYRFRAYAKCGNTMVYGEEMTFTTLELSGIDELPDENVPEVVCYFNTLGQRAMKPFKGINIVVYSDGTTRKVVK